MHQEAPPCSPRVSVWLALFSAACLPSGPIQGDETDGPPTLTQEEVESSSPAVTFFTTIVGEALADASRFEGTESLEVTDVDGQILCRWTWDTNHGEEALDPDIPCTQPDGAACLFAHSVVRENGQVRRLDTGLEADCEPFRGDYPMQEEGGVIGYGYADTPEADLLMVFADNPAPEADRWIALSGVSTYVAGVLEYRVEWGGLTR